jgi:hypothetical protein
VYRHFESFILCRRDNVSAINCTSKLHVYLYSLKTNLPSQVDHRIRKDHLKT